jgi:hypothetical protein
MMAPIDSSRSTLNGTCADDRAAAQQIGVQRPATALTGPTLPPKYSARRHPRSIEPSC